MTAAWTAAILGIGLLGASPALAQRSLFDQPVQNPTDAPAAPRVAPGPAVPAAPAPAPATAAPQPAAKPAPTAQAAPAEPAAEPAAEPKAKPKPRKPRGPVPARSLAVTNGSPTTLVALEVSQDGKAAAIKKPLASGKRASLKLPAFKGCEVSVTATFEGGQPETSPVDICKEKSLNFKG